MYFIAFVGYMEESEKAVWVVVKRNFFDGENKQKKPKRWGLMIALSYGFGCSNLGNYGVLLCDAVGCLMLFMLFNDFLFSKILRQH